MKKIPLSQGKVALVDDEDYDYLMQWNWCVKKHRGTYYARRSNWIVGQGQGKATYMHRIIMNTPDNMITDHIDHNGLNNQKTNLRVCTTRDNLRNRTPKGRSGYLGVFYCNKQRSIYAKINVNRIQSYLGTYATEELAARAYDEAARKIYGEYANLNFK